ncbi:hypothetical protein CcCBS67573_g07479 [Chytriomyces confervae]|uniref:Uncharacterized protein n=1 Tax=Chytriomyces confervae TaxID=246404 RepID=A0A507EUC6_9FUNG|nr:hypothetical protein CcCBS67573_g07479 [Chytriomyces confervae]
MNRMRRFSESFRSPSKSAPPHFDAEGEAEPIQLQLGTSVLRYENRMWLNEDSGSNEAVKELLAKNQALEAENQLLRFKMGVLLDMVCMA